MSKERLTVTIDSELVEAANQAVADGYAASLSAWVNLALTERATKERRLRSLAAAVGAYEREFGKITAAELGAQELADRRHGIPVRPKRRQKSA
jgi:Arc/MetJ-type ribon-helix-helix transcriptional regulator